MKTPGNPVQWYSTFPAQNIAKPGRVVSSGTLAGGLSILPVVGDVRGIFLDDMGEYWVRVAFPWDCGRVSTHHVNAVTGSYPREWNHHGDWGRLEAYCRQWRESRRRAGLADDPGIWPDGYVPLPQDFYRS